MFFNDIVTASLRAGNETHPVGSILVKELFEDDGRHGCHEAGKDYVTSPLP